MIDDDEALVLELLGCESTSSRTGTTASKRIDSEQQRVFIRKMIILSAKMILNNESSAQQTSSMFIEDSQELEHDRDQGPIAVAARPH